MPFSISGYIDPGSVIQTSVQPNTVAINTVPLTVCLIGVASRSKNVQNEAVTHGLVSGESLTVSSTPSAHNATLADLSNRQLAQTTILANGTALTQGQFSYLPATVVGTGAGTYNFTTNNLFSLALDGQMPVTFVVTSGGSTTVTVVGSLIEVQLSGVTISALTNANIVTAINTGLGNSAATALGYGPTYSSVASLSGGDVALTSPLSTPASDVKLFVSYPSGHSQTAAIFGVSLPYEAPSVVQITNAAYSGTATYTANYISKTTTLDTLANTPVVDIVRAGLFSGVTSFVQGTDYTLESNSLDFDLLTAATFTGVNGPFDVSTNNTIILALDGKASVTMVLNGLGSPPPGYANPGSPSAATATEIANNINAILAAAPNYGPPYDGVATVSGSAVVLTSPTTGVGSLVELVAPGSLSAVTTIFGLLSTQLPDSVTGTGSAPAPGAVYFVTYDYVRHSSDYNVPKQYFSPDTWFADFGQPNTGNQLALAGQICFNNLAPSVIGIQVNDATVQGSPTTTEVINAIAGSAVADAGTEIVVLDTRLTVQVALLNNVANESSPTESLYRRGWFGMPVGTAIGDSSTPGTFVYAATNTLSVSPTSTARGRLILVAPTGLNYIFNNSSGVQTTVNVDSTYAAAAIASVMTSFTSPALSLLRRTIIGFDVNTFPTYLKAQRAQLASNGVCVVTLQGGNLVLLDPMTTEAGGGKLVGYEEISASTQIDAVTLAVQNLIDNNLVGVVPQDLSLFLATVKQFVADALRSLVANGAIAPFKNADGTTRDLNPAVDIQVFQDPNNATQFFFSYSFNLRLPAKRFLGTAVAVAG